MPQRDSPDTRRIDTDPETDAFVTEHDWEELDSPSHSVIEAVAAVTGGDPARLRPLAEVIDTEALNRLFESTGGSARRNPDGRVSFRYEGCDVTVDTEGRTIVAPTDDDSR